MLSELLFFFSLSSSRRDVGADCRRCGFGGGGVGWMCRGGGRVRCGGSGGGRKAVDVHTRRCVSN